MVDRRLIQLESYYLSDRRSISCLFRLVRSFRGTFSELSSLFTIYKHALHVLDSLKDIGFSLPALYHFQPP